MDKDKKQQLELMRKMVEQRSWVRTPWRYTQLGGGLSLLQQQALLMVSEHLQGYIRRFFELNLDKTKAAPKSLFTEHVLKEGIPPFRIYLQDIGVQPSNYAAARKAIDEINLQVEYTVPGADGKSANRTELANVFTTFGFETTGDYYHYTDKDGERKPVAIKQPYIEVKINPDVAMWAFDMNQGYVNHLKQIAMYATKRSTPRIYLRLMKDMRKEQQRADIRIPFGELKEYLGIAPDAYPMFRSFRQKILDAVQQDLQRMSREVPPTTDITFTYDLQYPGRRKMGDPEAVIFHVERTVLGTAYEVVVNHSRLPMQRELFDPDPEQQPWRDDFNRAVEDLTAGAGNQEERTVFASLDFDRYDADGKSLAVKIRNRHDYDYLEEPERVKRMAAVLQRYFGQGMRLVYRIFQPG